jgi:signal transduction histidine kinase
VDELSLFQAGSRAASRSRCLATAAVATLVVTLVAMVLVPFVHERRAAPVQAMLLDVVAPTRDDVTALHVALATGEALHRGMLDTAASPRTDDAERARRLRAHADTARRLAARLVERAMQLHRPAIARQAAIVRASVASWAEVVVPAPVSVNGAPDRSAARRDRRTEGDQHASTMLEVARLDAAVAAVAARGTITLRALERTARHATIALGFSALVGLVVTVWLGLQLQRSRALAERRGRELARVVDARARFVRGMTHDLRHPVSVIDGSAWLLASGRIGPVTPAQRATLDRLRETAARLGALVDDLLELARSETGALALHPERVDLAQLVRDGALAHRPACERAGLALDLATPAGACEVETDPRRVTQVLDNLLSNAIKYTPRGGRVGVTVTAHADGAWRIAVTDTGPGIPPDRREFVFEEFSRLPGVAAPGVGLGLAIARRIARLLGGDLWVDPTPPGAGACLVLELPRTDSLRPGPIATSTLAEQDTIMLRP